MSVSKTYINHNIADVVQLLQMPLQSDQLHIYEFKQGDKEALRTIPPFKSAYFSIAFVVSGSVKMQIDLKSYTFVSCDAIIITADSLVQFEHLDALESMVVIGFMPAFLVKNNFQNQSLDILESILFKTPTKIYFGDKETETLKAVALEIKKRNRLQSNNNYKTEIIYHLFMVLIYEMANVMKNRVTLDVKMSRSKQLAFDFLKSLKKNCYTERSVAFYAGQLYISPNHLSEVVKKTFGKSAMKVINETTVLALKIQLSDPRLTIAQIADDFCFSSLQHLSQFYKNHTGLSPLQYREQLNS